MSAHTATALAVAISAGIALVRLLSLGLASGFPALLTWLGAVAAVNLAFGVINHQSNLYFWIYFAAEPLKCLFGVFAIRELFGVVFRKYPGIRSGGRSVMYAAMTVSVALSAVLTASLWSGTASGRAFSHLYYLETGQRSVVFALAFVIVAILVFLSKYPLHLSANTVVSSVCFCTLFLSETFQQLIDTLQPILRHPMVDISESVFMSLTLLTWALMLRPEREQAAAKLSFATPNEEHLLAQLNALNQLMTRSARR
jgi:hypothetical protein